MLSYFDAASPDDYLLIILMCDCISKYLGDVHIHLVYFTEIQLRGVDLSSCCKEHNAKRSNLFDPCG